MSPINHTKGGTPLSGVAAPQSVRAGGDYLLAQGDARRIPLRDGCVQCCVCSPPYWGLRDYQCEGQIGLEPTPDEFVASMVVVFREVRRVLRNDGTLWLNIGDSYAAHPGQRKDTDSAGPKQRSNTASVQVGSRSAESLKPKDLCMIPARVALALQADGWYLRSEITWCKTSPMPESVTDRPTSATEKIFLLTKSPTYYYDQDACRVASAAATIERDRHTRVSTKKDGPYAVQHDHETPSNPAGRNQWNYWLLGAEPFRGAHFAVFPTEIPRRAILLGTSQAGCCPNLIPKLRLKRDLSPERREQAMAYLARRRLV